MALAARPVAAISRAAVSGELAPEPVVFVGGLPAATSALAGGVLEGAAVVNATDAATAITQLNALLASLRASGAIA